MGRRQMAKTNQVYVTIFAWRPALRLEVKNSPTTGTGDIASQAALPCAENHFHRVIWGVLIPSLAEISPPPRVPEQHWKPLQGLSHALSLWGPRSYAMGHRGDYNRWRPCQLLWPSFQFEQKGKQVASSQSSEEWDKIIKEQHFWKFVNVPGHALKNLT